MSAPSEAHRIASRAPHVPTAHEQAEHLLVSSVCQWPFPPDADCPSLLLASPSGNGKSHLVQTAIRRARALMRHEAAQNTSHEEEPRVAVVSPSLADALASQQRDGSTNLRTVLRRAVLDVVQPCHASSSTGTAQGRSSVAPAWSLLIHLDHSEHFLSSEGAASATTRDDQGGDKDESGGASSGGEALGAFSPYPTLLADLYAVFHGCPPLFTSEECTRWHLRRLVFVTSFSSEHGDTTLHPFARAKLFDVVCLLDTPTEAERRRYFHHALARNDSQDRLSDVINALAQRTGGVTYAGLVEITELWWRRGEGEEQMNSSATTDEVPLGESAAVAVQRVVAAFRRSGTVAARQCCQSAGYVDVQTTRWADIAGMETAKLQLQEMVARPLHFHDQYQRRGVRHSTGVLLHGPPGTGKTMLAKAMATELNASFLYIDLPELVQAEVGESERKLKAFFDVARQRSPAVIFMDELQAAFGVRYGDARDAQRGATGTQSGLTAGSTHDARLVSQLLQLLDAAQEDTTHLIIFVGATNVVHLLDPLLLRPGRLDTHLAVPLPDEQARESLAKRVVLGEWGSWFVSADGMPLPERTHVQDALVSLFVAASKDMSGAELRNAMSVFALQLVQACVVPVSTAEGEAPTLTGEGLVDFLLRKDKDCATAINEVVSVETALSDAALELARKAFTTVQA